MVTFQSPDVIAIIPVVIAPPPPAPPHPEVKSATQLLTQDFLPAHELDESHKLFRSILGEPWSAAGNTVMLLKADSYSYNYQQFSTTLQLPLSEIF